MSQNEAIAAEGFAQNSSDYTWTTLSDNVTGRKHIDAIISLSDMNTIISDKKF